MAGPGETDESPEENRDRLNAFMHALDDGDESKALALIDELFAEDYVLHTGGSTAAHQMDVLGRQGLRAATLGSFRTFSNMQHIIEDEFGDDEKMATRIRFQAVLMGDSLGVSPSWSRPGARKAGADYEMAVKGGDVIEATIAGAATPSGSDPRR